VVPRVSVDVEGRVTEVEVRGGSRMGWKLSSHAFTRFWDVHAWSGVLGGLLLHLMFFTGAVTLFHDPIATWQEPLAQRTLLPSASAEETLTSGFAAVGSPEDARFFPAREGRPTARLSYPEAVGEEWGTAWIDVERARAPRAGALGVVHLRGAFPLARVHRRLAL
jgi:hypothetical protein